MEYPCFMKGCSDNSTLVCYCEEEITFCCTQHYGNHVTQNFRDNHFPVKLEIQIDQNDLSKFTEFFENLLNKEMQVKSQILNMLKEITQESEKIISNSIEICSKLKKILKNLKNKGIIFFLRTKKLNQKYSNEEILEDLKIVFQESKKRNLKYFKFNDYDDISFALNEISENLQIIEKADKYETTEINHEFLYFIKEETRILVGLNLTDFTETRNDLNFLPYGLSNPCLLQLDKDQLFIHGGRYTTYNFSNKTTLLDLKTFELQEMPNGMKKSSSKPILVDNQIYIFGGYSTKGEVSTSQMFEMNLQIWTSISELPNTSSNISSINLKEMILISGDNCLCLYHIKENNYETINNEIEKSYTNILLKYDGKVFLLNKGIYESNEKNFNKWIQIRRNGLEYGNIITSGILKNSFFYFASWKGNIFRFDCITKTVKIVRKIE